MTHSGSGPIVVFDGVCNFCAGVVAFILRRDRRGAIRFAPLQSAAGSALMRRYGLDPADAETFLFVRGGRVFLRSDAALEVARALGLPWACALVLKPLPRAWRDEAYGVLARNRYRWFGRRDACIVPTPAQRDRFLEAAPPP